METNTGLVGTDGKKINKLKEVPRMINEMS